MMPLRRAVITGALAVPMLLLGGTLTEGTAHAQGVELASPITTFAGNGTAGFSGDGGPATAAEINAPEGLAFDNRGNVYIADYYNNRIRVVTAAGVISTLAGTTAACPNPTAATGACGDGGPVSAATFNNPAQLQFDNAGNLYIADYSDNRIRKVTATNGIISGSSIITTVAGNGSSTVSGNGGPATAAGIYLPHGLAVDTSGNIYINDQVSCIIRKVTASTGIISNFAGNGTCGYGGDGSQANASNVEIQYGIQLTLDSANNLYIADRANNVVRKVTASTNVISTYAGVHGSTCSPSTATCGDGGPATSGFMTGPAAISFDAAGNLIIADTDGSRIRKVTVSTGIITTVAGTGAVCNTNGTSSGPCGDGGPAVDAEFSFPIGVALDNTNGIVYYTDQYANRVRYVTTTPTFSSTTVGATSQQLILTQTLTGGNTIINSISVPPSPNGTPQFVVGNVTGCVIGGTTGNPPGTVCTIPVAFTPSYPGVQTEPVIISTNANTLQVGLVGVGVAPQAILAPAVLSTVAGTGVAGATGNGAAATAATLSGPREITFDYAGNYYIGDLGNNEIREVNAATGNISVVAGGGTTNYVASPGGAATSASLNQAEQVAFDSAANMYIPDYGNHVVSRVDAVTKDITVIAGTGVSGNTGDGGPATSATLTGPAALAINQSTDNIFVVDGNQGGNKVRLINVSTGLISTYAGTGAICSSPTAACGDGGQAALAQFYRPQGIAIDASANIFIADTLDNRIRRIDGTTGIITTVAGTGAASYSGDGGAATSATLNMPFQVQVDAAGDLFIADSGNNVIRMVSGSTGIISTVAGTSTACATTPSPACGDGGPGNVAAFSNPLGVALDLNGNIYVVENNRVRKLTSNPAQLTYPSEPVGTTAGTMTETLLNIGNAALTYTTPVSPNSNALVTTTGPTSATSNAFTQSNSTTCGPIYSTSSTTTLAAGANCNFVVSFTPDTAVGNYTGTLVETDNSLYIAGSTQTVTLAGAGTALANAITFPALPNTPAGSAAPVPNASSTAGGTITYTSATPSICTVNSTTGVITDVAPGTCTINANQGATGNYAAAAQVSQSYQVTALANAITVTSPTSSTAPATYSAGGTIPIVASSTSGQAITYASQTPSVCSVDPTTGVVTTLSTGTCTITLNQAAAGNYGAATQVTQTFNIGAGVNTINFPALPNTPAGSAAPVPAATSTAGGTITYTSATPSICTVNSTTGVITDVAPGTCTINANQAATGNYAAASQVSQSYQVTALANTITVTSPTSSTASATYSAGGTIPITASSTSGQPITYASTTPSVCSVNPTTGVVTTLSTGVCTITLNQAAAGNYGAATQVTQTFNIGAGVNTITFPMLTDAVYGSTPQTPAATATSGQPVTYSTTSTACSVTSSGAITYNSVGPCAITASQAATGNYAAATSVTNTFNITAAADTITVPGTVPTSTPYTSGGTFPIGATTTSGVPPTYTSATPLVCSVSSTGVVTILSSGTCTVNVSQPAAGNYAAATTVPVTVNIGAGANSINFPSLPSTVYGAAPPTPGATSTSGQPITYTSNSPTVCTVTSSGVVTVIAIGTCSITASQPASGSYGAATPVTQTFPVTAAADTITVPSTVPTSTPYTSGGTFPIGATTTSGVPPTYTSATPLVCSVSSTGIVTTLSSGTCTINVSQPAAGNYAAATTVPVTVNLTAGTNVITFPSLPDTVFGATAPVPAATATSGQPVTYTSTTPLVCSVTSSGVVTDIAIGICSITASQPAAGSYAAATPVTNNFNITPAPNTITVNSPTSSTAPAIYTPGGTIPIVASSTSGQPITYASLTPGVCSVNPTTGVVTTLGTGTCTITLNQPAGGNYAAATQVTQTFNIGAGANVITFPALPNTVYGTTAPVPAATATSGQPVTYSTTSTACSVTSSGVITDISIGVCTITASQPAAGNYAAATPVTQSFNITPAPDTITFPSLPTTVLGTAAPVPAATSTSGQPVTYTSTTPLVCSVTSAGVITDISAGVCTITASQPAAGNYAAATPVTQSFNITPAPDFTIAVSSSVSLTVIPGGTVVYTYALAPLNGAYPGQVVNYTATGTPPGSTYTITPASGTITSTGGPQTLTLTIITAQPHAMNRMERTVPWTLAALLPLFFLRKSRRRLASALMVFLVLAASTLALTGCGIPNGFFGQPPATYSIVVTATSGAITHSAVAVTLQVQ